MWLCCTSQIKTTTMPLTTFTKLLPTAHCCKMLAAAADGQLKTRLFVLLPCSLHPPTEAPLHLPAPSSRRGAKPGTIRHPGGAAAEVLTE